MDIVHKCSENIIILSVALTARHTAQPKKKIKVKFLIGIRFKIP